MLIGPGLVPTREGQARIPTEYQEQGEIALDSAKGFQTTAWGDHDESLTSCSGRLGNTLGEILVVLKSVAKFPLTSGRSRTSPTTFLDVRAATQYQILFQPPRSVWSHLSRISDHCRAATHSQASPQHAGKPGESEQVEGLSINVSPKMEQTEKSDNLEQLLCYSAWWGAGGTLLKAFENKNTSILGGLGDSLSCEKSLLTTQWHQKGIERRDAQHKDILKGVTKGNETKAISLSTLLQNYPLHESKDWESAKVSS
ncbi:hypothetical protein BTVI_120614 [Pitangus sulphuratus]|nr:hypothetical protein BTVI_120614 [Pitangus sulphuratus]